VVFSAFAGVTDELIKISQMTAARQNHYQELLTALETRHFETMNDLICVQQRSQVLTQIKVKTNELADVLQGVHLVKELTHKTLDFILSFGEQLSATIIAEALKGRNIPADFYWIAGYWSKQMKILDWLV